MAPQEARAIGGGMYTTRVRSHALIDRHAGLWLTQTLDDKDASCNRLMSLLLISNLLMIAIVIKITAKSQGILNIRHIGTFNRHGVREVYTLYIHTNMCVYTYREIKR